MWVYSLSPVLVSTCHSLSPFQSVPLIFPRFTLSPNSLLPLTSSILHQVPISLPSSPSSSLHLPCSTCLSTPHLHWLQVLISFPRFLIQSWFLLQLLSWLLSQPLSSASPSFPPSTKAPSHEFISLLPPCQPWSESYSFLSLVSEFTPFHISYYQSPAQCFIYWLPGLCYWPIGLKPNRFSQPGNHLLLCHPCLVPLPNHFLSPNPVAPVTPTPPSLKFLSGEAANLL